jgi:quinol monooxygenase YgiN
MFIITARVTAKPERKADLIRLAQDLVKHSRQEEGCLSYSVFADQVSENALLFYEEWADQEAIERHSATSHFKAFMDNIPALIAGQPILQIHTISNTETL